MQNKSTPDIMVFSLVSIDNFRREYQENIAKASAEEPQILPPFLENTNNNTIYSCKMMEHDFVEKWFSSEDLAVDFAPYMLQSPQLSVL